MNLLFLPCWDSSLGACFARVCIVSYQTPTPAVFSRQPRCATVNKSVSIDDDTFVQQQAIARHGEAGTQALSTTRCTVPPARRQQWWCSGSLPAACDHHGHVMVTKGTLCIVKSSRGSPLAPSRIVDWRTSIWCCPWEAM
jgi:hypothetical protein